jgi:L-amino acid N-acyltransferase YncA
MSTPKPSTSKIKPTIRPATPLDIPSITEIHTHYTLNTVITFKIKPTTAEQHLGNLENVWKQKLPYLVAVSPEAAEAEESAKVQTPPESISNPGSPSETPSSYPDVLGSAYVSGFRSGKAGYLHTVELSLFVSPSHLYEGIGTALLTKLISVLSKPEENKEFFPGGIRSDEDKVRQVIACMAVDEDGKEDGLGLKKWYESFGFVFRGHLKEVGWKFGKWCVFAPSSSLRLDWLY